MQKGDLMVKVFLVDDHEVVRRGLVDLLSADDELQVIGEAGSVAQALARIPALQPDVAVLDVRLPDGNADRGKQAFIATDLALVPRCGPRRA